MKRNQGNMLSLFNNKLKYVLIEVVQDEYLLKKK